MIVSSTMRVVNPYLQRPRGHLPPSVQQQKQPQVVVASTTGTTRTNNDRIMGCQSQRRNGSVKSCKKRGTRPKVKYTYKDRTIDGSAPAVCFVCDAKKQNLLAGREVKRVPKRAHHKSCQHNRKTKGMSESASPR